MKKTSYKIPNINDKTHAHTHLLVIIEKPEFPTGNNYYGMKHAFW